MKTKIPYILVGIFVLALVQLACSATSGKTPATAQPDATVATGNCPALNTAAPKPSGIVKSVTMAEDTSGDNKDPVNPTNTFGPSAEFHAVVSIEDAPSETTFKAVWYATDTNGEVECNTKIDEYELQTDGTRNVDFSLSPKTSWPEGVYRVEIFVNSTLDQIVSFSVK